MKTLKRHYAYIKILLNIIDNGGNLEDVKEELIEQSFEIGTELGLIDKEGNEIK